jgi:hypothetical protein
VSLDSISTFPVIVHSPKAGEEEEEEERRAVNEVDAGGRGGKRGKEFIGSDTCERERVGEEGRDMAL